MSTEQKSLDVVEMQFLETVTKRLAAGVSRALRKHAEATQEQQTQNLTAAIGPPVRAAVGKSMAEQMQDLKAWIADFVKEQIKAAAQADTLAANKKSRPRTSTARKRARSAATEQGEATKSRLKRAVRKPRPSAGQKKRAKKASKQVDSTEAQKKKTAVAAAQVTAKNASLFAEALEDESEDSES